MEKSAAHIYDEIAKTDAHMVIIPNNKLSHHASSEDALLMLDDSLPQASVDRFVFGLQQRKWKEWDILQFTASVRTSQRIAGSSDHTNI